MTERKLKAIPKVQKTADLSKTATKRQPAQTPTPTGWSPTAWRKK